MKTLVTVTRTGDAIRISKVTAHGEEVIEPDMEAKALAVLLWSYLAKGNPVEGTSLLPWDHIQASLSSLTRAVEVLTAEMKNTQHMLAVHRVALDAKQPTPVTRGQ